MLLQAVNFTGYRLIRRTLIIVGEKFTIFALFYFVSEGNFQVQAPKGAYFWRGDLTEDFLRYEFGGGGLYFEGVIHGRAHFRNFAVVML